MSNTLVDPVDLADFPGAPFEDALVDAVVADIRSEAGWHIAPEVTETITVPCYGGTFLPLPSKRIVAVTAVRNGGDVLPGWTWLSGGLYRTRGYCGWPVGMLEVDLTHGYAATPQDLFPVIVGRVRNAQNPRDPSVSSRTSTAGPFTEVEQFNGGGSQGKRASDPVVSRYSVAAGIA